MRPLSPSRCIFWKEGTGTEPDWDNLDKVASVGKVVRGCEVRTVDGEIQVKSPSVMKGYYNDEELTKEAITDDGWLRTGDIGYVDEDNYLFLTGRKKNLIILSNGENVAPEPIENMFINDNLVEEIIVVGDDDVIAAEIDIIKEMGVEIKCGVEVGKDITIQQLRDEGYESFCLAIGAQAGAKLNIPGEDLVGVFSGVDFLHAAEDKAPAIGNNVAVIGGGNVAMDVARAAIRLGADVTVVYRRKEENMPADPEEVAEAKAEGVKFVFEHKPVEIIGKDGKVCALKCDKGEETISAANVDDHVIGFDV